MYKPSPLVRGATLFVISMLLVLRGGSAFRAIGGRVAPSASVQRTIKSSTALFAEVKRMSALQFGAIINDPDTRAQYQIVDVRELCKGYVVMLHVGGLFLCYVVAIFHID